MMEKQVNSTAHNLRTLLLVCSAAAMLSGCLLNSVPVPVVYGEGASYSPYSMPKLHNGERVVTVEPGDSVSILTDRYHADFRTFVRRNDLKPPYVIYPGQRLVLPPWQPNYDSAPPASIYADARQSSSKTSASSVAKKKVVIASREEFLSVPSYTSQSSADNTPSAVEAPQTSMSGPKADIPVPGIKPQEDALRAEQRLASNRSWKSDTQKETASEATPVAKRLSSLASPPARQGFIWPVQGEVVLKYGAGAGGLFNDGINIRAPRGTAIHAADNGVVTYVGNKLRGFGNLILIKHSNGYVTAYAHTENPIVARGDVVKRGQKISSVGSTGAVTYPQLHFEIRQGRKADDPIKYLPQLVAAR